MSDGAVSFASKYQQKVGLMLCSNYNEDCRRHYKSMQLLRDTKRPRLSCNVGSDHLILIREFNSKRDKYMIIRGKFSC